MAILNSEQNCLTQPLKQFPVFNNWNVVTKGWYFVCKASELPRKGVKSLSVCGQRIVIFRGEDGTVRALDGYCPHMGVDLGIGSVEGNNIRCFFHHWQFNQEGKCVNIPCQEDIPKKVKLQSYDVQEKLGLVWVYPDQKAERGLLEIPGLEGLELEYKHGTQYQRSCHHHITMINGIDPQHLRTVHNIHIDMDLKIDDINKSEIVIELSGKMPQQNMKEKIGKWLLGDNYAYSMKYADGCLAGLTVMKDVKLFGRFDVIPRLYMYFAYRTEKVGETSVLPIYVTPKRKGLMGKVRSWFVLWVTKRLFFSLQDEDGQVYENIRFRADNLLKIDTPVAKYIAYINRLEPSMWSRTDEDA